ncbi:hypothetical protein NP233_g10943 [Leucocoprinus birnbaumii]|uniref:Uncharacterized protein n=1 Tax=Leucocoprinus birnbaumii TaxID=56174 RepID=A0AAD5YRF0_9AGAR|nr:hypothetical protein NP233_g10943 [Leucocoprinus birnbaumii]
MRRWKAKKQYTDTRKQYKTSKLLRVVFGSVSPFFGDTMTYVETMGKLLRNALNTLLRLSSVTLKAVDMAVKKAKRVRKSNCARKCPQRDRSQKGPNGLTKDQQYYRTKRQKTKKPEEPLTQDSHALPQIEGSDLMLDHALGRKVPWGVPSPMDASTYPEMSRFTVIFKLVSKWAIRWGGMENWANELKAGYESAKKNGADDEWYDDVWLHAHNGCRFQNRLSELHGTLPVEDYQVRELYRREIKASVLLAKGITIIEVRVPLFFDVCSVNPRGLSPLPPSSELDWESE